MKKLFALLLSLLLVFGCLVACGEKTENASSDSVLGVVSGKTWTNSYLGLEYRAGSGVTFASEKELLSLSGIVESSGVMDEELLENTEILYALYAKSSNQTDTVTCLLEKGTVDDTKEFCESMTSLVKSSLESIGYTVKSSKASEMTVGGKKIDVIKTQASIGTFTMYQVQFPVQGSEYLASVTVTAGTESDLLDLLGGFSWLD